MRTKGVLGIALLVAASFCGLAAPAVAWADDPRAEIDALIKDLGADQYAVRARAQKELSKWGHEALDALAEAQNSDDPEISTQAAYLVRAIRTTWSREGDSDAVVKLLQDYEALHEGERIAKVRQLSDLPDDQGLLALCRLARFERMPLVAKHAALAIIKAPAKLDADALSQRVKLISTAVSRGQGSGIEWLQAYVLEKDDPAAALAAWSPLIDAERQVIQKHPGQTSSALVMALLRRKLDLLDRTGRTDEVQTVLAEMVRYEHGDPASLLLFVELLYSRQAGKLVDDLAERFSATFSAEPVLIYMQCDNLLAQGEREKAEKLAQKALKAKGDLALDHMDVADRLTKRGMKVWAERELQWVVDKGPLSSIQAVRAAWQLKDSLYDREKFEEASVLLDRLLAAGANDPRVTSAIDDALRGSDKNLVCETNYLRACAAGQRKDVVRQREYLLKAFAASPDSIDVMIALYQASADEPQRRAEVLPQIKRAIEEYREEIATGSDSEFVASSCNQLAWLVANTEGDLDEALRLSHRAVEIYRARVKSEDELVFVSMALDTLGRCYYAAKDFAAAVKYQSEAVRLEPHSGAMNRQLELFRAALAAEPAVRRP